MSQTIRIRNKAANTPAPPVLTAGELAVELSTFTRLWVGTGTANRLLLSNDPAQIAIGTDNYVQTRGDTMTGALIIQTGTTANAYVRMNQTGTAHALVYLDRTSAREAAVYGRTGALARWAVVVGNTTPESATDLVGSDFAIARYNNAGTVVDWPMTIARSTGIPNFPKGATTPTPAVGDNDTSIATTAFVKSQGYVAGGPFLPLAGGTVTGVTTFQATMSTRNIEAGNTAAAGTPYIDFHSSGTASDYDVRLLASGGTATAGQGKLTLTGAFQVSGATTLAATTATTPATADNTTKVATTAWVRLQAYAPLNAPVFTGDARAVTPATADNDTSIATTAFVKAQGYATNAALGAYVLKAGDTMTGTLNGTTINASTDIWAGRTIRATTSTYPSTSGQGGAWQFGASATGCYQIFNPGCWDVYDTGTNGRGWYVNSTVMNMAVMGSGDFFIRAEGFKPSGGVWGTSSDARIKKDVRPYLRGLTAIMALEPKVYSYIEATGYDPEKRYVGLIADDVEKVMPECVGRIEVGGMVFKGLEGIIKDGLKTFNASDVTWALVNAVKELAARLSALEAGR